MVCVYPTDDLEVERKRATNLPTGNERILVEEGVIRNIPNAPANVELTIRRLKERGLLPLTLDNPRLALISRILGHVFSDGSFTHNKELRNGRPYSHFTFDICLGDADAVEEIRSDLSALGFNVAQPFKTTHVMRVDGRSYTTTTVHIKFRDTALCTLLRALGAPVGSKVKNGTEVPGWLFKAPIAFQREFLAAYMGGDGEAP